uniref:Large ribosomal subunit protein mL49 n=1 Tax=Arion vulgaris TaxID=1028688 RepID=A0A0B6ZAU3_9EUPU
MATSGAIKMSSALRACLRSGQMTACLSAITARGILRKVQLDTCAKGLSTSHHLLTQSQTGTNNSTSQNEYPVDYETSYSEFKYVEQILPTLIIPDPPQLENYPTPSGWIPPNDDLRSQHSFLVRRTKNHMLPVFASTRRTWAGPRHRVAIKKIEGDIWAFESALRNYLHKKSGNIIKTQVHEVCRIVLVKEQYAPLIADFLLECGM